ncbi:MAG: cell wall hydrolase [Rhizobiales bacterium]|jgi:spore germination cell wall hydrolase CwlJ-like protein|nr:cell wall hydrolase [Hyphomicrobiales bacterium]
MRSRNRQAPRKRPSYLRYALAPALFLLGTQQAAYQDLGSLLAKEANIAERARAHLMQGALSSLKTATLSLPTNSFFALPEGPLKTTPRFDPDITGSIPPAQLAIDAKPSISAAVERTNKADRMLVPRKPGALPQPELALSLETEASPEPESIFEFDDEPRADRPGSLAHRRDVPEGDPTAVFQIGSLLFDPGADTAPPGAFKHRQYVAPAIVPDTSPDAPLHATRKLTPAERLKLNGASRAKAVKCLAEAIYFEARSEPERGQMAVAQVVVNRAFSGYYPNDICGVVYQNKHRHLACQFTYACDGIPDIVNSKPHWRVAERLANEALDGKGYLQDVGKATHYHAYYVSPYWARKMRKMVRIGAHTFYFPYEWEVSDPTATAGK